MMEPMRNRCSSLVAYGLCLLAACGDGDTSLRARTPAQTDAGEESAREADAGPSASDGDAEATAGEAQTLLDAAHAEHDAGGSALGDALVGSPDPTSSNCAIDAGAASTCEAYLCKSANGTALALRQAETWRVGALDWVGALCARSIGWGTGTSDRRHLLYLLTAADVREINAGTPISVYWGGPGDSPGAPSALGCAFVPESPTPDCPVTATAPRHASFDGCRAPMEPNCAVCQYSYGGRVSYRSSDGGDWYNVSQTASTACSGACPQCASCTQRDQTEVEQLGSRPECLPCPLNAGLDPCYMPRSCDCWCSRRNRLYERCPTLAEP
jgi:hypothetical protein